MNPTWDKAVALWMGDPFAPRRAGEILEASHLTLEASLFSHVVFWMSNIGSQPGSRNRQAGALMYTPVARA